MIYFYSGRPGSGKSLHCARVIDEYHRRGRNVITNFEVNLHFWDKHPRQVKNNRHTGKPGIIDCRENETLSVDYLLTFADKYHARNSSGQMLEKQTLLVIDECQTMFNARSWNQHGRQKWNIFFTQHRKFGYTVILISQAKEFIDRQIRSLLEYDYEHRNIGNYKVFGKILSLLCGGGLYVVPVKWMSGGKQDHVEWFFAGRKYFPLYDSYKIFDTKNLRQLSDAQPPGVAKGQPSSPASTESPTRREAAQT